MATLLQQLDDELARVVERASRSLVQVRNGRRGAGSGIIVHQEGLIVTNAHVVGHTSPKVTLRDGTTLQSRVLAQDTAFDLAALSVETSSVPAITLGESKRLKPGQWVLALGHPWGISGAVTAGVVIGVGSEWPEVPPGTREWIAVNLPLRPGNSGGPLIDVEGRLLGINTVMTGPDFGLAVPVHVVKAFLKEGLESFRAAA